MRDEPEQTYVLARYDRASTAHIVTSIHHSAAELEYQQLQKQDGKSFSAVYRWIAKRPPEVGQKILARNGCAATEPETFEQRKAIVTSTLIRSKAAAVCDSPEEAWDEMQRIKAERPWYHRKLVDLPKLSVRAIAPDEQIKPGDRIPSSLMSQGPRSIRKQDVEPPRPGNDPGITR